MKECKQDRQERSEPCGAQGKVRKRKHRGKCEFKAERVHFSGNKIVREIYTDGQGSTYHSMTKKRGKMVYTLGEFNEIS